MARIPAEVLECLPDARHPHLRRRAELRCARFHEHRHHLEGQIKEGAAIGRAGGRGQHLPVRAEDGDVGVSLQVAGGATRVAEQDPLADVPRCRASIGLDALQLARLAGGGAGRHREWRARRDHGSLGVHPPAVSGCQATNVWGSGSEIADDRTRRRCSRRRCRGGRAAGCDPGRMRAMGDHQHRRRRGRHRQGDESSRRRPPPASPPPDPHTDETFRPGRNVTSPRRRPPPSTMPSVACSGGVEALLRRLRGRSA